MDSQIAQIVQALNSSEDDLLAVVGYYCSPELHGLPPDKNKLSRQGSDWLNENMGHLQSIICHHPNIQKAVKDENKLVDIAIIILNVFAQKEFSFPVLPIVAILLKRGLTKFCNDTWKSM